MISSSSFIFFSSFIIPITVAMAVQCSSPPPPTNYGVVVFNGFQALDVFGPLDILNLFSMSTPLNLSIISDTLDPVSTQPVGVANASSIGQRIVPTHTFSDPPADIEVLLVPGGAGTRNIKLTQPLVDFVGVTYPKLRYLLSVCTGSALVARTGLLDGKKATSNKLSFDWVAKQGPDVDWVRHARWVSDGNLWTSSGISAGIDMVYAFVSDQYGEDVATRIAKVSEYIRNTDSEADPFSDPS